MASRHPRRSVVIPDGLLLVVTQPDGFLREFFLQDILPNQRCGLCPPGKPWRGVDVQRIGGTPWKAYAGGTGVPPMRNAQMTIPFMIATGTNEMRTTAKARRVDV